jgi:hypothetical protein
MKRKIAPFPALFLLLFSASSAFAESDFFTQEDSPQEALQYQQQQQPASSFSITSAFGGTAFQNGYQMQPQQQPSWQQFENLSGTDFEKKFYETPEMRMRRELKKPAPKKKSFNDEISDVEERLNELSSSPSTSSSN